MKVFLTILSLLSISSFACKLNAPKEMNMALDLDKSNQSFYNSKVVLDRPPHIGGTECSKLALKRKYIMIGLGQEVFHHTNDTSFFLFNTDKFQDKSCKLTNNALSNPYSFKDIKAEVEKKNKLIRECVEIEVSDFSKRGLNLPKNQIDCKVTKLDKMSALFSGNLCFFRPNFDSQISVQLRFKPSCRNKEEFSKLGVTPQDFQAFLNIYSSGDATGDSIDLTHLTRTEVRISVNPPKDVIGATEFYSDKGPTWPTTWNVNEVVPENLRFRKQNRVVEMNLPVFVDHTCEKTCKDGICTSPCDYQTPVVAKYELYEVLSNGKREYIEEWYDGNIVQGQWQGLMWGLGKEVSEGILVTGKKYSMTVSFFEPDLNFNYFDGRIRTLLRLPENNIRGIDRGGAIRPIPLIGKIPTHQRLPVISEVPSLNFNDGNFSGVTRQIAKLKSRLKSFFWPPSYDNVCLEGICQSNEGEFLRYEVNFTYPEENEDGELFSANTQSVYKLVGKSKVSLAPRENAEVECK